MLGNTGSPEERGGLCSSVVSVLRARLLQHLLRVPQLFHLVVCLKWFRFDVLQDLVPQHVMSFYRSLYLYPLPVLQVAS